MSHLKALRHEGWRKAIHLSMLVLPVWIVVAPEAWRLRGLLIAFFFLLGVDLLRLRWKPLGRWLQPRLDGSLRPGEKLGLTSAHYWTLVACFLAWCGPERLAAAALAMPIVGDAAAAVVGRRFGRKRYGSKSLEGSAACFAGCMLAGAFFLPSEPLALAAAAGAATVVEALPLPVDDNLSVPLVAALVLRWCV